jgi:Chaperone of endosialidase
VVVENTLNIFFDKSNFLKSMKKIHFIIIALIKTSAVLGQGLLISPSSNDFFLKSNSDILGSIERTGSTAGFLNFYYGGATGIANPTGNHIGSIGFAANNFIFSSHGSTTFPENILFRTNNTDRLFISHDGNVGIGDATPSQKLDVAGTVLAQSIGINAASTAPNANAMLDVSSTTKGMLIPRMTTAQRNAIPATVGLVVYDTTTKSFWFNDGTTWQPMNPSWDTDESKTYTHAFNNSTVLGIGAVPLPTTGTSGGSVSNGRLQITGIGNGDQLNLFHPSSTVLKWGFYVSGIDSSLNFYYSGSLRANIDRKTGVYLALSDRNLKKNIIGLKPVLDNVLKLNAYKYNYLKSEDSDRKTIGFMAQDVLPYFPELVYQRKDRETNEPFLMMDYSSFGVIAIKAIQEQQAIINNLQTQIDELKKLIVK